MRILGLDEVMGLWFFIGIPLTVLITFLFIRKKIAPWLGLEDLRRDKDSRLGGIAVMISKLIYSSPSSHQIMKVRLLILSVILLAPEGSGLFMYLLILVIIQKDKAEELAVS